MNVVATFLTRKSGGKKANWLDYLTYAYLIFGFAIILVPVLWLGINSLKPSFQLEKQDISLLPTEFERVARATVKDESGNHIFIIADLPDWALHWKDLSQNERDQADVKGLLSAYTGKELIALRSHLGQVPVLVREVIEEQSLPAWLLRFASMSVANKQAYDVDSTISNLSPHDQRLIKEFLGIPPYKPARLVSQILAQAPDPQTGEMTEYAISNIKPSKPTTIGRYVDNRSSKVVKLPTNSLQTVRYFAPAWENYTDPLTGNAFGVDIDFAACFTNSILATVIATLLTLMINSMAAFALSKYRFRGQIVFSLVILATLMVPPTITLVGLFKAINATGLMGSIWGVIIPGAATPTGVFLLRQYMLTIPDELLEAARMDAASEWKVYWRIMLPLTLPALAALGILSVIWRWNDLILPLVAIATTKEAYTIQLCLLEFRGEHLSQEHYRLAMTMVSLIPSTLVFVFLQKYITAGIANTGLK